MTVQDAQMLEVEGLTVEIELRRSTVRPVDDVSFSIGPGQTVGLVGESGCGKSTIALALLGLLPAGGRIAEGRIRLGGQELTALDEEGMRDVRGNRIGVVFQDPLTSLNPTMTIGDQVGEPLRIHQNASRRAARDRAVELLQLVGLPSPSRQLDRYPHQLSGGMRQRISIATALACNPALLIADEPTTALDVTTQDQILELFGRLKRELDMAVLLITHDMGVVAAQADWVLVMYAGKLVEVGTIDRTFYETQHRYTEALLKSIPRLTTSKREELYSITGRPPDLARPPAGCRFAPRCAWATEECRASLPELLGGTEHAFACIHPVGTAT
ncbi:ABC transporter ATP-binding protein [Candidatus Nephthysia bennettiae]|uniref:ABC transporter ATP-binding protein n=1 Tax=Candidatus Nephthysia bennettiae TaxID=3127016 RepID=UPI0030C66CDF